MININATLLIQLVNFLLLMYLLNRLLFRPMVRILEERRERTEGRQQRAAQVDAEAEAVVAQYEKRIHEAKTEAERVRANLVRQGEAERQKVLDSAAAEAQKTLAEIRARVRGEADQARRTLRDEANRLAADAAERILGEGVLMRRLTRRLYALAGTAALTLGPALVWAAGAEGGGSSPIYDLIMKFVNFGILAGILYYFLRKPVSQGLADRREDIRKQLEEARQAKEEAEAKYREYQARVANLEEEVRQIHEDFQVEGERLGQRIVEEAGHAAAGIRRQAEAAGANEVKRAVDELRTEVASLTVELAAEMLTKAYTPDDQKKAVQHTVDTVEEPH